jgi:hypothetical protein
MRGSASRGGMAKLSTSFGARDDVEVFVDHDGGGEPAHRGLEGQELLELVVVVLELRFVARDVDRHDHDVGAHDLRVVAQIGLRHDQRIFDRRARARREQPVEAAVERDAGDDGDQDGGRGGDDRKQADDANVQLGAGAPGTPCLHHQPNLAHDDAEQQQHRGGVHQQQRDDDVMGRRDRRQIGQHDEGGECRQHREADRDRAEHPRFGPLGGGCRKRGFGGSGLFDAQMIPGRGWQGLTVPAFRFWARGRVWPSGTDAFLQQCCRIATNPRRNNHSLS